MGEWHRAAAGSHSQPVRAVSIPRTALAEPVAHSQAGSMLLHCSLAESLNEYRTSWCVLRDTSPTGGPQQAHAG